MHFSDETIHGGVEISCPSGSVQVEVSRCQVPRRARSSVLALSCDNMSGLTFRVWSEDLDHSFLTQTMASLVVLAGPPGFPEHRPRRLALSSETLCPFRVLSCGREAWAGFVQKKESMTWAVHPGR